MCDIIVQYSDKFCPPEIVVLVFTDRWFFSIQTTQLKQAMFTRRRLSLGCVVYWVLYNSLKHC